MPQSIFSKLTEFNGNPIDEFNKIDEFMHKKVDFMNDFYYFFDLSFPYCTSLSSHFTTFKKTIDDNTCHLFQNKDKKYNELNEENQKLVLEEFLNYCQIILYTLNIFVKQYDKIRMSFVCPPKHELFGQLENLIKSSLESMSYKVYDNKNNDEVEIVKKNPEAEIIASQSSPSIKENIISYLATNYDDCKKRKMILIDLINNLEPTLSNYSSSESVKDVKRYVQLLRHHDKNEYKENYAWFYKHENDYYDDLFSMILFVQQYHLVRDIIKRFNNETNKANKENDK